MADQKITALTELTTASSGDLLLAVDAPSGSALSQKLTVATFAANHNHAGFTSESITGYTALNVNSTSYVDTATATVTISAGDSFTFDYFYMIRNNSGGTRTYTACVDVNGFLAELSDGTALASSGTNRYVFRVKGAVEIRTASLAYIGASCYRPAGHASGSASNLLTTGMARVWNSTTSDLTGASKVIKLKIKSSNATGTQEFDLTQGFVRRM